MKPLIPTLPLYMCLFAMFSCGSSVIGNSKDVNPATVYMNYFAGDDESDTSLAIFLAQFRFAGAEGTSLVLNAPAKIILDGSPLAVDSALGEGAFYEVKKQRAVFAGLHTVVFTGNDGHSFTNNFFIDTFRLVVPAPRKITPEGLLLLFNKFKNDETVLITIEDSGINTKVLDTIMPIKGNTVLLPQEIFSKFRPGPITIDVHKYYQQSLEETTAEGGRITVFYWVGEIKCSLLK